MSSSYNGNTGSWKGEVCRFQTTWVAVIEVGGIPAPENETPGGRSISMRKL